MRRMIPVSATSLVLVLGLVPATGVGGSPFNMAPTTKVEALWRLQMRGR